MLQTRITNPFAIVLILSVIVFVFNAVPSTVVMDDSDQQITTASFGAQRLPTLFVFGITSAGIVLLSLALWRLKIESDTPEYDHQTVFSYIARGPPAR